MNTFLDIIDHNKKLMISEWFKNKEDSFTDKDGNITQNLQVILPMISTGNHIVLKKELHSLPFFYLIKEGFNEEGYLDFTEKDWNMWKAKSYLTGLCKG